MHHAFSSVLNLGWSPVGSETKILKSWSCKALKYLHFCNYFPGLWKWASTMAPPSVVTLGDLSQQFLKWRLRQCLPWEAHPLCRLPHPCHYTIPLTTIITNKSSQSLLKWMKKAMAWRCRGITRFTFSLLKKVSVSSATFNIHPSLTNCL